MSEGRDIVVLGAGIVGTCCALALRRDGHRVTLIDRDEPGSGCSSGNAGMIQTGSVTPVATPGVLRDIPRMLTDPQGALVIRWRYLPTLLPWLARFVGAARPKRVAAIAEALHSLLRVAKEAYQPLLSAAAAGSLLRHKGELYVYRGEAAFRAAASEFGYRRSFGIPVDTFGPDELRQVEPELDRRYDHAYYLPDSCYTVDPLRLTQALALRFAADGGKVIRMDVRDIEVDERRRELAGPIGRQPFETLVLATGAFSKRFATRLGARVPLETGRGYHLMVPNPGFELQGPVIDGEKHFAVVPMTGGLRLAGMMELAGLELPMNEARAAILLPLARRMLPSLRAEVSAPWMGHRPITPDSLPVIGRSPTTPNVLFAFGHGQLGLTLAGITGKLIADLVADRPPAVDLTPYRPTRF